MQFYGEPGVRMDRLDSAFNDSSRRPRSIAFNILSPFLFFMPYVYMKELDNLYVDHTVHYYFWRQFITGLKRDWENSITPVRPSQLSAIMVLTHYSSLLGDSVALRECRLPRDTKHRQPKPEQKRRPDHQLHIGRPELVRVYCLSNPCETSSPRCSWPGGYGGT